MATIYTECQSSIAALAKSLMRKHTDLLADLLAADVSIKFMWAASEKEGKPALKLHGYACAAIARVNSYKNRAEGMEDCSVHIDKEWWDDHDDEEREATLTHELYHFMPQADNKSGGWKLDDAGRPKVKMRKHNWDGGGWHVMAARFGTAALEVQNVREVCAKWVQLELPFTIGQEAVA